MRSIDIFGTCYSREIFNHTKEYIVNNYIMQQSLYTLDGQSLNISADIIKSADNYKFKERMMYYELNKLAIQSLKIKHTDLILVDLYDQIRDYLQLTNTKMIGTSEMKNFLKRLDYEYKVLNPQSLEYSKLVEYITKLIELLVSIYGREHIILNISQIPHEYYENNIRKEFIDNWIIEREELLKKLEQIFISLLPDCRILKTNKMPIVDINHYLGGPHPVHFESIYYEYKALILDATLRDKDLEPIEEQYKQIYDEMINNIKSKKILLRR